MKSSPKFPSQDLKLLKEVYRFARKKNVTLYLVGGALRDLLLGRVKENPDFDFAIKMGAINFAGKLAKEIRAGFVVLDKEHGAARLVKKINGLTYTLDFTDFRGHTLQEDLKHRDFSINSLALSLGDVFGEGTFKDSLIDPWGGIEDINKGLIRMAARESFTEDPLRILRAFSFSAIFGFPIEKKTLTAARVTRNKLSQVSGERIRDELFKIFDSPKSFEYLQELDRLKILEIIFPEIRKMRGIGQGPYHHLDVWQHTLETVKQLEVLLDELKKNRDIQDYLDKALAAERKRRQLLKLGAILHDVGKPASLRRREGKLIFHGHESIGVKLSEDICRRLKLSNDEISSLKTLVLCHLRPGYLADNQEPTARAIFRYFRDSKEEAVGTLLVSIADQRATKGPLTTRGSRIHHEKICTWLIRKYFNKQKEKKIPRLLNGDDLIKKFALSASPLIGKVLSEIEELQAIGRVKNKAEALKVAAKMIGKHNPD